MIRINKDKVLLLQQLIIQSAGGSDGVRDFNLLDSAISEPFQTFDGQELYATKEEKGARIGFNLISNHAFVDGNKRIGIMMMLSFLEANGIKLHYTDDELIEIGFAVASGTMGYEDLLLWVKKHHK